MHKNPTAISYSADVKDARSKSWNEINLRIEKDMKTRKEALVDVSELGR